MQPALKMVDSKAEILLVDDVRAQGEMVTKRIGQPARYEISSPESLEKLRESIIFKLYEAVLIDVVWNGDNWRTPIVLGSHQREIYDGIDFARFIFELTPKIARAIALYSSIVDLDDAQTQNRIDELPYTPKIINKPLPVDREQAVAKFGPLLEEANYVHNDNPLLKRPSFAGEPLTERLRVYKSINAAYSKWIDFNFESTREYSWVVVSGLNVQKNCYGMPLNGGPNHYGIVPLETYPSEHVLNQISHETDFFPFMFWNARKIDFLEALFETAGVQLVNIPAKWRSFFGIAVARQCANAYLGGKEEKVLDWCGQLDEVGKVEVAKRIYKTLYANSRTSLPRFADASKRNELPVIEDVLVGKVDKIDRNSGLAKLTLRTLADECFIETIPLARLLEAGIEFEHTWFEYSVYRQSRGQLTPLIERIDPDEEDDDE